ncbi:MAG: nucleotidyltransferase domain-containing protein [Nitrososphaerota archaeon]|nr:nucleotidyltransferase domain-containing protein [Nitrososphaerota archaeon]
MEILRLLGSNPVKSFYQREVARTSRVSVGKTNQVLKALEENELVTKEHVGKVDLYRYNLADAAARSLKVFFNASDLRVLTKSLRSLNGTSKVVLFGSCAEGTDTKDSDIDVFILTQNKGEATAAVQRVGRSLERKLSPIILDALEFSKLKKDDLPFYEQVSRGMTLWQREE